uniref:Reverse transcriptase Ty1/copia-type domain-containing protein n=1 Tax=Solanum lycopersicum TaxID=4081 RepID=A0A3Q7FMD3_SOLLC
MDNRRSKSCYIFLYSGTRISLCNKKLDSVSLSTMDAEYKQRLLLLKNVYGSKDLLKIWHLSISKPIMIYGDNQSVIKLANNLFHERTKPVANSASLFALEIIGVSYELEWKHKSLPGTTRLSPCILPVTVVPSDQAARMSTPGALKSGYRINARD